MLVVDDETRQLDILKAILGREGFDVDTETTAEAAVALLRDAPPPVILTDLKLPGMDGIGLLDEVLRTAPQSCVIFMTAHGTIDTAVEAMKKGAFDYLTKPLVRDTVVLAVRRAMEKARLLRENLALQQQLVDRFSFANIIGDHGKMQDVFRLVMKIAPSASTALIYGESGTGKELIARAIHYNSPRRSRPFLAELFGHEKGAFTGAIARKIGLFEEASGSTLFLDEIGDLGVAMQAKLLRALQQKEIRRVGGNESIRVDVRIIAATNKSLTRLMQEGKFREDLYYRLNVLAILLPPLRERTTDIPRLVSHFIARHAADAGKNIRGIDDRALAVLMRHPWPGNVRQLESAIERAVLLAEGETIGIEDLPQEVRQKTDAGVLAIEIPDTGISFEALEKQLLEQALQKGRSVSAAARLLGMTRRTLQYRLKKFGLSHPSQNDDDDAVPAEERGAAAGRAPNGASAAPDG